MGLNWQIIHIALSRKAVYNENNENVFAETTATVQRGRAERDQGDLPK